MSTSSHLPTPSATGGKLPSKDRSTHKRSPASVQHDAPQWIVRLDTPLESNSAHRRDLLGGKGAGLKEMFEMGIPTPPALILTTDLCNWFYTHKKTLPDTFEETLYANLAKLESEMKLGLGDADNPLLVSVRSGARASMPGMMDTILNLGLNDTTVASLARNTNDERFAFDSYRRFIQMYSNVVLGMDLTPFEDILEQYKKVRNVLEDSDLGADDLKAIVGRFKEHIEKITGDSFPQDTRHQLIQAIKAVLRSWMNKRAVAYRALYNIPEDWGTAVTLQAMVFGNLGDQSGTGVAFTRDPATGEKVFFGEYLLKAQGEDVVAGIRTPDPLTRSQCAKSPSGCAPGQKALEEVMPKVYQELCAVKERLETHYKDMQDIEFTIQKGHLWILQTRNGKRTAKASVKMAVDMVNEGLIDKKKAICRFDPPTLDQLLHPCLSDVKEKIKLLGTGLPASPGAAVGRIAFSPEDCLKLSEQGERVILVRDETSPEDIEGMAKAKGILTACGGMTSHAAVVARGMGKPCIVGTADLYINQTQQQMSLGGVQLKAGDFLTLEGSQGHIFEGKGKLIPPQLSDDFHTFMGWADEARRLSVRANADTPQDVLKAFEMGAEGIGLCRTEHMFFESDRILAIRKMILAPTLEARQKALRLMFPMQRDDFEAMLRAVKGKPLTVRLLDPPLHEFLPQGEAEIDQLSQALNIKLAKVRTRLLELKETNPMLGNRGCRLGLTMPEVYDMQIMAIIDAALRVQKDTPVHVDIMIPLISLAGEFRVLKRRILKKLTAARSEQNLEGTFNIGTMIELPRAALKADKIAREADFMSFGTNDLTQTTFGFSRDDVSSFLGTYRRKGILVRDPFASLDQSGVGELIKIATEKARSVKPDMKFGVCGEQGADPGSIAFFEKLKLDYISCSPYRVPIARLAAAGATLKNHA
ncbi:MAG: pyruvate, phosphate dikinase [Holosporaceae bacterium]